jgi:hypothetical protein
MNALIDVLLFRKMLAPVVLQILFWAGIGGTLYGSGWLLVHGNWAWWIALVFGSLATRLIFELALLRFQAYASLTQIERRLDLLTEREPQR